LSRRSKPNEDPESIRKSLIELLSSFEEELKEGDLRRKVKALIPAFHKLRDLGCSLIPPERDAAARDRIIAYLRQYPLKVIDGDELMVVSGIAEWARRVRELRVQLGWSIYSGVTFHDIIDDAKESKDLIEVSNWENLLGTNPFKIKPDQYVLTKEQQDKNAAYRWHLSNEIRKKPLSVSDKIIEYFRKNAGEEITGEELKYLAKDKKEWARRVRELRTEQGWPIVTKNSGRDDLAIGVYVLEEDKQAYEHDRAIPDTVRISVLKRDRFKCAECGWSRKDICKEDPRKNLELHHIKAHKDGGENSVSNLITLCNVCHDNKHRA